MDEDHLRNIWFGQYILDENGEPVRADFLEWAEWMAEHDSERQLANDQIGNAEVSTIFLGIDSMALLNPNYPSPPRVWESMIFGGPYDLFQKRYTSRAEALDGHKKLVQMLTN